MASDARPDVDWPQYLATFHSERAGITEDVLGHARDKGGRTPYDWAADAVPSGAAVVDLACGSGAMAAHLQGAYVGFDLSAAELAAAAQKRLPVARADATRLPLADGSAEAVVMSMALMLVPLAQTLAEVRRVLRPGGAFVATVPTNRPMPARDWLRYARLCVALRHPGLSYPNDGPLQEADEAFGEAGLTLHTDEERTFMCDVSDENVSEQLLASLYLPDVAPDRFAAGRKVVHRWVGSRIATPIRLLVARG